MGAKIDEVGHPLPALRGQVRQSSGRALWPGGEEGLSRANGGGAKSRLACKSWEGLLSHSDSAISRGGVLGSENRHRQSGQTAGGQCG